MDRSRNLLVFVSGSTPQIITETIWALINQKDKIIPDEILIITTSSGKNIIKEQLIDNGLFRKFTEEFGLKDLHLTEANIHVLRERGMEISDVRDSACNKEVAEQIIRLIYNYSQDPNIRIIASLAGGRKTMGYYLGFAMSLFGRPDDLLLHVLVSPQEFESNREFFYKPKRNTVISKKLNTKDAKIELIHLPFVRLRSLIDEGDIRLYDILRNLQEKIDRLTNPLPLRIKDDVIYIGDIRVDMPAHLYAFYLCFLQKKKECKLNKKSCTGCDECFMGIKDELSSREFAARYLKNYRNYKRDKIKGEERRSIFHTAFYDEQEREKEPEAEDIYSIIRKIRENISEINSIIRKALGPLEITKFYLIDNVGRYGKSRYGVQLDRSLIKMD